MLPEPVTLLTRDEGWEQLKKHFKPEIKLKFEDATRAGHSTDEGRRLGAVEVNIDVETYYTMI